MGNSFLVHSSRTKKVSIESPKKNKKKNKKKTKGDISLYINPTQGNRDVVFQREPTLLLGWV